MINRNHPVIQPVPQALRPAAVPFLLPGSIVLVPLAERCLPGTLQAGLIFIREGFINALTFRLFRVTPETSFGVQDSPG